MTLLELLRQELPKRGGWPEGQEFAWQDANGEVRFSNEIKYDFYPENELLISEKVRPDGHTRVLRHDTFVVTREQYEATSWDGTGLPPVGCECEIYNRGEWFAVKLKFIGDKWIVAEVLENGREDCYELVQDSSRFRPLRTEAEHAIDEMVRLSGVSIGAAKILYDAGYRK